MGARWDGVPTWSGSSDVPLEQYVSEAKLWLKWTDVAVGKQGPALVSRLTGKARLVLMTGDLSRFDGTPDVRDAHGNAVTHGVSGVHAVLTELRKKFGVPETQAAHADIKSFYSMQRTEASVDDFLNRFSMNRERAEKRMGGKIPESLAAPMLLEAGRFTTHEKQMIISSTKDLTNSDSVSDAIRHIMSAARSTQPVLFSQEFSSSRVHPRHSSQF